MPKMALGRGLGALIPESTDMPAGVVAIDIDKIRPNEYQPRKRFDEAQLQELAASIKAKGIIQPVIVRRDGEGVYSLITGERRWRAAKIAGLSKIPAIIKDVAESELLEVALIENIQREDLNPIETAEACQRLIKDFHLTQEAISERLGMQRSSIANYLRILRLPYEVKQWIADGSLTMGHAKAILSIEHQNEILRVARKVIEKGLSVRETETAVERLKRLITKKTIKKRHVQLDYIEDELKRTLGTKVRIIQGRRGGKVEIEYYSTEDLDRIIEVITGRRRT
ncbi:MAG: ParB/RepB/Spo0J family partition protein [Nitrospirota bacterium]